jgi:hypothetical protein
MSTIVNTTDLACSFLIEDVLIGKATRILDKASANLSINLASTTRSTSVMDISQQTEQFQALIEDIVSGEDTLKRVTFNLLITAQNRKELDQKTKDLLELSRRIKLENYPNFLQQIPAFTS